MQKKPEAINKCIGRDQRYFDSMIIDACKTPGTTESPAAMKLAASTQVLPNDFYDGSIAMYNAVKQQT